MSRFKERITTVREEMAGRGIDAIFLPPTGDMEYLTGIRRQQPNPTESHMFGDPVYGVIITPDRTIALVPYMASKFMARQVDGKDWIDEVVYLPEGTDIPEEAIEVFRKLNLHKARLAVPKHGQAMTLIELQSRFPEMRFANTEPIISPMRAIKHPEDLALMERAARITDLAYLETIKRLKVGMSESEVAHEAEWQLKKHGAEGVSFITGIYCRSPRTAAGVEDKVNRAGDVILHPGASLAFDIGAVYEGYCSDFGRTVYIGEPPARMQEIHRIVMQGQAEAAKAMVGGQITAAGADKVARDYITAHGYGEAFFHRLGHGIGLDVHERPYLSHLDETLLQNGMTLTVEPIVWLDDYCLIRVEDVVTVTPSGGRSLHQVPTFEITVIE